MNEAPNLGSPLWRGQLVGSILVAGGIAAILKVWVLPPAQWMALPTPWGPIVGTFVGVLFIAIGAGMVRGGSWAFWLLVGLNALQIVVVPFVPMPWPARAFVVTVMALYVAVLYWFLRPAFRRRPGKLRLTHGLWALPVLLVLIFVTGGLRLAGQPSPPKRRPDAIDAMEAGSLADFQEAVAQDAAAVKEHGTYWLRLAAGRGQLGIVRVLLDAGVVDDAQYGTTALFEAAAHGWKDIVELLIDAGASVDSVDNTTPPLIGAAAAGHRAIVELLLSKGADVLASDSYGKTALHAAAGAGAPEVVQLLLSAGARPGAADDDGTTPLHVAAMMEQADSVAQLLAAGAPVDARNSYGRTALYFAADMEDTDSCRVLLAHGADVALADAGGDTPLARAEMRGYAELAELLRRHGGID